MGDMADLYNDEYGPNYDPEYSNYEKETEMKTREFYIAGVQFHESDQVINGLKVGDELVLNPDPTNKFDSNAVEIIYGFETKEILENVMLGFVPNKFSGEIAAALTISDSITCTITEVTPSAKPWERIKVEIKEA